ncbi:MAG TPA: peptide-methionine (S)-S-oxide reductase MsrA [Dermatophilaceae bacterium]|nr:peptide-methionine (S)-S-oxide reductase MsrA [Dermatophilaceae bacterium]
MAPFRMFGFGAPSTLVEPDQALPGRADPLPAIPTRHEVLGTSLRPPWPEGTEVIYLGMGCFWGAEKLMWQLPGVVTTAAGYMGGYTPNASYEEVCSGRTGHTETVLVAYDPARLGTEQVLAAFWENHDPTQGMRQGNDVGTQYRSAIFWTTPAQEQAVHLTGQRFQSALTAKGFAAISTDTRSSGDAGPFYYAEAYHQQYLHKNPSGYCPVHATGVSCHPE